MKDVLANELLSAYLDGELTAGEQAQVERLLAQSPAARQLMDELRALSSTLQEMPRYKLGEDISHQVLRLAGGQTPAEPARLSTPPAAPRRSILRVMRSPRAWVYSGLAVAAAVMLMVIIGGEGGQPGDDKVAMVPEKVEEPGPSPATRPHSEAGDLTSAKKPLEKTDGGHLKITEGLEEAQEAYDAPKRPPEVTPRADPRRGSRPGPGVAAEETPARDLAPAKDLASTIAQLDGRAKQKKSGAGGEEQITVLTRAARDGTVVGVVDSVQPRQYDMIARYRVSSEANRQRTFDELLADNKIVWSETPAEGGVLSSRGVLLGRARQGGSTGQKPEGMNGPVAGVAVAKAEQVLIQATTAQIKAVLDALGSRPEAFRLVSLERTPGRLSRDELSLYSSGGVRRHELREDGRPTAVPKAPSESYRYTRPTLGDEGGPMLRLLVELRVADLKAPATAASSAEESDARD